MMKVIAILMVCASVFLSGCEFDEKNIEPDQEFQLKLGKTYEFLDYKIKLKSIEDSRCPLGVECFWQGEATLEFKIGMEHRDTSFVLSTLDAPEYYFKDYVLKLLEVAPYPSSTEEIDDDDYRISIRIESNIPE